MNDPTEASARRVWGGRWVAFETKPFVTRGQGRVWLVWDNREPDAQPGRRTRYALKELRYEAKPGSTKHTRFVREIEQTLKLSQLHKGVVPVIDHGIVADKSTMDSELYYVMPFAESSLERAKDLKGQLDRVLEIGEDIADALAAAHVEGVIHRDVKPANVLLVGDVRQPSMADFGICFLTDEDRLTGPDAETVGSKEFVAPELLGGGQVDEVGPAADVYSLGKTLYAAASGGTVFPRESFRDSRWNLVTLLDDPRFEHLNALLDRMCALNPADRYATMMECRDQMAAARENLRKSIPYRAGMYGGEDEAVVRGQSLLATLESSPSTRRDDAVRRAVDEAHASAVTAAGPHSFRTAEFAEDPATLAAIYSATNHQLSAGLPLVVNDQAEAFGEWLAVVTEPVHRTGPQHHRSRSRSVLRGAAVLSLYVAAALAFRLRRFAMLRSVLVELNREDPGRFIHLDHLGSSADRLYDWLVGGLGKLSVLEGIPGVSVTADDLAAATGLMALFGIQYHPKDFLDRFPGLTAEAAARWVPGLAFTFRTREPVERAVAGVLLDLSPTDFRSWAAAQRGRIIGMIQEVAPDRDVQWGLDIDPQSEWARWTGAVDSV